MKNEHATLIELLEANKYDYSLDNDTLIFRDARIKDIENWYSNRKLYHAIRADKSIRVLDLSLCPVVPKTINDFPYIEEIRMPILNKVIPSIQQCPNLYHIDYDASTIIWLEQASFRGWPPIDYIKFSSALKRIDSFGFACKAKIVDFSECINLTLNDHCFQGNDTIRKCVLPRTITKLPSYAFMGCKNLTTLIAPGLRTIVQNSLSGNFKLRRIIFSDKIVSERIIQILHNDDFFRTHSNPRAGIILDIDENFIYLFSFENFKFYYTEINPNFNKFDFVSFTHDLSFSHSVECDGILLYGKYAEFHAIKLEDLGISSFYEFSNKYTTHSSMGLCVNTINLQQESYQVLMHEIKEKLNSDLRRNVSEIVSKIESLEIDEIIESYHTTISEWVKTKVGGNDTFYSVVSRGAKYNDPYLETILPTYYSYDKESAYTTRWDYADKTKWLKEDEQIRKFALTKYNKEEHISFLLRHYVKSLVLESFKTEKYLHISRAIEVLEQTKLLTGKDRIEKLNEIFFI